MVQGSLDVFTREHFLQWGLWLEWTFVLFQKFYKITNYTNKQKILNLHSTCRLFLFFSSPCWWASECSLQWHCADVWGGYARGQYCAVCLGTVGSGQQAELHAGSSHDSLDAQYQYDGTDRMDTAASEWEKTNRNIYRDTITTYCLCSIVLLWVFSVHNV